MKYESVMDDFKKELKDWLKRTGKNRYWLADEMGAKKSTVDGWFSGRGKFPVARRKWIENLMKESEPMSFRIVDRSSCKAYSILLSVEEYELIEKAASMENMTVEEWSERQLIKDARIHIAGADSKDRLSRFTSYKAAEETPEYGGEPGKKADCGAEEDDDGEPGQ